MAEQKDPKPKAAEKAPGLRVTAKREGFRRAGWNWSTAPIELPAANFSKEEIAALRAEPMLVVEDIEIAAEV
ncbi:HI1506-related protein [Methylogaea oryzae]|uniref:Mu-like prophage FluMu N-terminal domain-containing protein n=1 Tax=Methylogaea oryzae TaxID=1295382 RepID=A0A8D4VPL3_9GAMM|nr:HI1506-related protein [Methylogaea oryzae]BBL70332.1 hypothetical protein MoryE10_09380 [Methylogaea oryzae]